MNVVLANGCVLAVHLLCDNYIIVKTPRERGHFHIIGCKAWTPWKMRRSRILCLHILFPLLHKERIYPHGHFLFLQQYYTLRWLAAYSKAHKSSKSAQTYAFHEISRLDLVPSGDTHFLTSGTHIDIVYVTLTMRLNDKGAHF